MFDGYEVNSLGYPETFEVLLPRLSAGQLALDLGIGAGHLCAPIAFAGLSITGVDSSFRLATCQENFEDAGLGEKITTVSADALEFLKTNTQKFDLVIMSEILMFMLKSEGKEAIRLAYGALNLGGHLWIITKSTNDDFHQMLIGGGTVIESESYFYSSPCGGSGIASFYYPKEIDDLLKSLGASVVYSDETVNEKAGLSHIILAQKPN